MLNKYDMKKHFNFNTINNSINGFQKVLTLYDKVIPIIASVTPFVNNIKSTINVVRVMRKMSNDEMVSSLLDNIPDSNIKGTNQSQDLLHNKKVENPYYPWYTKCGWEKWMLR